MTGSGIPRIGRRPSPRVLLWGSSAQFAGLAGRLEERVPTVRNVADLEEVNQDEWDVIVTDVDPGRTGHGSTGDGTGLRKDLCVVSLVQPRHRGSYGFVGVHVADDAWIRGRVASPTVFISPARFSASAASNSSSALWAVPVVCGLPWVPRC